MRIAFIGNFIPSHSTENDRAWTLEKLGHTVIKLQENITTSEQLLNLIGKIDILFYSHTHDPSYQIKDLIKTFKAYKANGVPTASIHLDRWAWLAREKDVGVEATWYTEYTFMADGSPEAVELYEKHGLNWHFIKAGVVERDCYIAPPDYVKYPEQIVFTGSKGYHPEYPFRPQLVDFLHNTYGSNFAHYGGGGRPTLRGEELNILYSSAKIVVGDSCFGGRPNYVSDRYYEVRGRGGFLLHPQIEGVDHVGVGHYDHGDFEDLKKQINLFLSHDELREDARQAGFNHVKKNETYTQRMLEVLEIICRK